MQKALMTVLVAGLAFLTACTVQWYTEHPKERAE